MKGTAMATYDMTSTIEALQNLGTVWRDTDEFTSTFARCLAGRIGLRMSPVGVVSVIQLLIYDIMSGTVGAGSKSLHHGLVGMPPAVYATLRLNVPILIETVAPAEFAKEFAQAWSDAENAYVAQ